MKKTIFEVPPEKMEYLVEFVQESNELLFFALLKIISHFHFLKALSNLLEKGKKPNLELTKEITEKDKSFLSFLSWYLIIFPEKRLSFYPSASKAVENLILFNDLTPQRKAELKIIFQAKGDLLGRNNFFKIDNSEDFLIHLRQDFEKKEKNLQQILRELTIFFIDNGKEEFSSPKILMAFIELWKIIYLPLLCLFQDLVEETKKTRQTELLFLLYEQKIIFSSEIIFHPEFCVN